LDERDELLVTDDTFEKDLFGDILIEGERAGVDGDGEADRVGEPLIEGIFSGIDSANTVVAEGCYGDSQRGFIRELVSNIDVASRLSAGKQSPNPTRLSVQIRGTT
jgi:hypothetical protein